MLNVSSIILNHSSNTSRETFNSVSQLVRNECRNFFTNGIFQLQDRLWTTLEDPLAEIAPEPIIQRVQIRRSWRPQIWEMTADYAISKKFSKKIFDRREYVGWCPILLKYHG